MLPTALRGASSLARRARRLSSSASAAPPTSLWRDAPNVDASRCFDPLVSEEDLQVLTDVLTEEEEMAVADECMKILKRRRYEENHWDSVIVKFKEMERSRWSPGELSSAVTKQETRLATGSTNLRVMSWTAI